jgi:transposase
MKVTTVGIDLAKTVFQIHGVDEHGKTIVKKQIKRDQMAVFFVLRASLAWKLAAVPTTGRASSLVWATWLS